MTISEPDRRERACPPRTIARHLREPNAEAHGEHRQQRADDAEERHGEEDARGGGRAELLGPSVVILHVDRHVFSVGGGVVSSASGRRRAVAGGGRVGLASGVRSTHVTRSVIDRSRD
jgi:hypothetical protein